MTEVEAAVPRAYRRSALAAGARGAGRAWRVVGPVVLVNAAVQSVLVAPDPVPGQSSAAGVLAAVSFAALLVTAALLSASALGAVDGPGGWASVVARARRSALWFSVWFVVWVAAAAVGLALGTWPGLVWLVLTPYLLLAASDGRRGAIVVDLRAVAARPGRWLLTTVVVGAVAGLAWALAAVIGFFVGGVAGAALTWLLLGALAAWLLTGWAAVYRSTAVGASRG